MIIDSKIQAVTVYKDRAHIERIAQANLAAGEQKLIFSGLPFGIDPNSIQINGGKSAILLDIKLKDIYHNEITDEEKKAVFKKIEALEAQIEDLNDRLNNTNLERTFLQNLAPISGESSKKSLNSLFQTDKLQEMLKFYNEKLNQLDDSKRAYNKEIRSFNNQLQILRQQYNTYNQKQLKSEKQLEIKINATKEGPLNIIFSYLVMNASWSPFYDLRMNSEENKLKVGYNAIVKQKTGEKWDQVIIKLSTARPQISAIAPSLNPWYVNVYKYPETDGIEMNMLSEDEETFSHPSPKKAKAAVAFKEETMKIPVAQIETGATSVIFAIPGLCSISDNDEEHKIGITNLEFDTKMEYNSIPKISPFAYLTSTSTNHSDFPMLAGKANVFLDDSFVANSLLKLVAPNEEFKTSLGVDEAVKIEHKLVNKFTKDEGLFSKKNKIIYEYSIEIKNNKKIDSLIKIKDQVPLSQNQEIKVELIEPKYKEDTEFLKKGTDGIIEWTQLVKPGGKVNLNLKFSVEYPKDLNLMGLE